MNINWLREDLNMEASFWAQLPGNHAYIARSCMLSSANFSGFSSLHNFATGQGSGNHWGTPISILETTSQTPYWFNFHQRDIGHFLVTGPTGSGKTVALTFLLAQAFRISPEPKAVFFDKDRGAEIFVRAVEALTRYCSRASRPASIRFNSRTPPPIANFCIACFKAMLDPADGSGFSRRKKTRSNGPSAASARNRSSSARSPTCPVFSWGERDPTPTISSRVCVHGSRARRLGSSTHRAMSCRFPDGGSSAST